jgi:RNA polymerase sigma-32 factor
VIKRKFSSQDKNEAQINFSLKESPTDVTKANICEDSRSIESSPVNSRTSKLPSTVVSRNSLLPARTKDLAEFDPLQTYLREIRGYSRLSREEEHELAVLYREKNDLDAAYRLVSSNLWLVVKISREYERAAKNLLDLVQEGNIGLMEAVKNFDPFRNVRFPSYAVWWIKAYIIRYIMANWRLVKIGTTQAQRKLFFNLKSEKEKLEREGIYPSSGLLAERLNVREQDVVEMEQRMSASEVSFDAPLNSGDEESDSNLGSLLAGPDADSEELLNRFQKMTLIKDLVEKFKVTLKSRELTIFEKRLLGEDKVTLQDLSEELSLSRERVRQLENRIKEKLKIFVTKQMGADLNDFIDL